MNTRKELDEVVAEAVFLTKPADQRLEPTWEELRFFVGDAHPIVMAFRTIAGAVLAAIEAHGAMVVPKEPTAHMASEGRIEMAAGDAIASDVWRMMLAASPFAENPDA